MASRSREAIGSVAFRSARDTALAEAKNRAAAVTVAATERAQADLAQALGEFTARG